MEKLEYCKVAKEGALLVVTIDRPEVMNALYAPAHRELSAIWSRFQADDDLTVAILTGAGDRAFSAGNDLKQVAAGMRREHVGAGFGGLVGRFDITKPVIAAVNGVALGGGFELALACDLIIAAEHASFALPEPLRGLVALGGGIHRLPRQIPLKQAMGILLTGRRVSAQEALSLGLVNEIAPPGQLMDVARQWAGKIMEASPNSIRITKEEVMKGLAISSLETLVKSQEEVRLRVHQSRDAKEGPKAFAEKRKPVWKGC